MKIRLVIIFVILVLCFAISRLTYLYISKSEERDFFKWKLENYTDLSKVSYLLEQELKKSNSNLVFSKSDYKLSKSIEKFLPIKSKLARGINNSYPGSAFIDSDLEHLYILSSSGIIAFSKIPINNENLIFRQIQSNLEEFLGSSQLKKHQWFSYKDLLIHDNDIYLTLTYELSEDCWNTSILKAKKNTNKLKFEKFFIPEECVSSKNNRDNEFVAHQSGGRIKILNDEYLILTTGEYRSRYLAQDQNSVFGKILKIDLKNGSHKVISIGHRNPQGLEIHQNLIFITEHGPSGGDEINMINLNDNIEIKNYGWPISSYGEHYDKKDKNKYSKYPLHNSHEKYGFIEPLKYFNPSIGISEIIMIEEHKYLFSSMRDRSLYYFDYDNVSRKITDIEKIFVGERIRDLVKVNNNTAIMFMEDTASIGFIDLDQIKEEFFK